MPPQQPTFCQVVSPRKRNSSTSLRFQEPIRHGEILCDVAQNKWKIGRCVGVGAFGEIYLASNELSKPVGSDAKYVIKVEPHSNGPLFVEMNFYLRVYKEELIENWKKSKHSKYFGLPRFYGFGSHYHLGERYRFIVLAKLGDDINKIFIKHSKRFHIKTAFTLAGYILDSLEYIHSRGYVHSDIKGMNMVLGNSLDSPVYLLDFGLVSKYCHPDGTHKEYKPDGRKAQAGTMEFSSRDAHIGAVSRRSDLESLGYNLIRWLNGHLPWEKYLSNPELVAELKEKSMGNVKELLASSLNPQNPPEALVNFLMYTRSLNFNQKPDYAYCKRLFNEGIRAAGYLDDARLTFDQHARLSAKFKKRKTKSENILSQKCSRKTKSQLSDERNRRPCSLLNHAIIPRVTRNLDRGVKLRSKNFNWAAILAGHPEKQQDRKEVKKRTQTLTTPTITSRNEPVSSQRRRHSDVLSYPINPTPAMLRVIERKKKRESNEPFKRARYDSLNSSSNLTPAMEEVIAKRQKVEIETSVSLRHRLRSSSRTGPRQNFLDIYPYKF